MLMIPLYVGCLLGAASALPDGSILARPEKDPVTAWIRQLGSSRFQEREAATHALEALGESSLEALQRALRDTDAEVRRRAASLIQQIQQRAESARLLTPIRVKLDYDDVPISEVIQDLTKKSGARIRLSSRRADGTGGRLGRLTLHTGMISFWEALDQVCMKAGLVERATYSSADLNEMIRRGQMPSQTLEAEIVNGGSILLEPGSRAHVPTSYAGGVRLRALPLPADVRRQLADQTGFMLEILPQPTLNWRSLLGVRIDRAVDQDGQSLEPVFAPVSPYGGAQSGIPIDMEMGRMMSSNREYFVRLHVNEKPSRTLQEVRGAVLAQVQSPREPLVTINPVLQSAKKTFTGKSGEVVSMLECTEDQHGSFKIHLQLKEILPQAIAFMANGRAIRVNGVQRRLAVRGNVVGIREQLIGSADWTLVDDEGTPMQLNDVNMSNAINANGFVQDVTLVYRMPAGVAKPAKLIYSGQRLVNIEIPFGFSQVPLP